MSRFKKKAECHPIPCFVRANGAAEILIMSSINYPQVNSPQSKRLKKWVISIEPQQSMVAVNLEWLIGKK